MEHVDWGAVLDAIAKIATALGVIYAAWKGRQNGQVAKETHEIVNSQRTVMTEKIATQADTIATQANTIETQAHVLADAEPPLPRLDR